MRKYEDTYQHKGLRKKLIDILREKGITDERVLEAIRTIPRHYFLDSAFDKIAYEDRAFPIAEGQTISQPYTVAYQTQLLQIKPFDKVLEIGTFAPFDKVIITAAAPFVPPKLIEQMKTGATMVIPLNEGDYQRMLRLTKKADGTYLEEVFENFSFVPMLTGKKE